MGVVLKYNADYVSGTACDIVMPTGMQLQGGAILFENISGGLEGYIKRIRTWIKIALITSRVGKLSE